MRRPRRSATLVGIRRVAGQIAARFRPRKIILFGSYAAGRPSADSDVDLLVVMDTRGNPLRAAARISAAVDHPFPLDILVFRPRELEASLRRRAVFATEVANAGMVLYEA